MDRYLTEITPKTIDLYIEKKQNDGNKAVSVATNLRHIRRFINFCISRGYMSELEILIPKYEKQLKQPYSDEELRKLLAKPKTNSWVELRNWAMINYFFATGQRLTTVLNIKVSHVDLDKARVLLVWNKDRQQKYMPLSTALVKVLREYIQLSSLQEDEYLFPEFEGKQLKKRSAQDSIADYNHSRGVEKTSIHLLRHAFARNYILNGGSAIKLQKLLNHKTIGQTMTYVHIYANDIYEDLDIFNPLDVMTRSNRMPKKRRVIGGHENG